MIKLKNEIISYDQVLLLVQNGGKFVLSDYNFSSKMELRQRIVDPIYIDCYSAYLILNLSWLTEKDKEVSLFDLSGLDFVVGLENGMQVEILPQHMLFDEYRRLYKILKFSNCIKLQKREFFEEAIFINKKNYPSEIKIDIEETLIYKFKGISEGL